VIVRRSTRCGGRTDVGSGSDLLAAAEGIAAPAAHRQQDHGEHRHRGRSARGLHARARDRDRRDRAAPAINLDFFTKSPNAFGGPGGGISSALIGSAADRGDGDGARAACGRADRDLLTEFAPPRVAAPIQLVLDVLNGLPTIVTGIFVYGILVVGHTQSAYAGAFALATVMLRSSRARRRRCCCSFRPRCAKGRSRSASVAGGPSWRDPPDDVRGDPHRHGARRRACRRRDGPAALHVLDFNPSVSTDVTHALPNLPVLIFNYSEQPDKALHEQAWGAALVLMAVRARGKSGRQRIARPLEEEVGDGDERTALRSRSTWARWESLSSAKRTRRPSARSVFDVRDLEVTYGPVTAISGVNLEIYRNVITAMIGPSGLWEEHLHPLSEPDERSRARGQGRGPGDVPRPGRPTERASIPSKCAGASEWSSSVRTRSRSRSTTTSPGGRRVLGMKQGLDERVEKALTNAALWDEVKDRLKKGALSLSGGQQQRLCIARAIAIEPDVLLLDEPASALDPIATSAIEDLMHDLKRDYTLVIVTHNMQQAARVADQTAFFSAGSRRGQAHRRAGGIRHTNKIFTNPSDKRTKDYVTGRFGMRTTFQEELRPLGGDPAGGRCTRSSERSGALSTRSSSATLS